MRCLEASLALYAALGSESTASRELSITTLTIGAPLTQPLTYRASEAVCWVTLTMAQVNSGQPSQWRRALALSKESQNDGVQVTSTVDLTHALLEAGAYEEALVLTQHTLALARTLPLRVIFQRFLTVLGSVSHALQQWEEARRTLEEAVAVAEGPLCVPALTRLCMHSAEAGRWEQAYSYAMKVINIRKRFERLLIMWEFYPHYETEALLRGGDERQAREAVQRHGERPGPNRRYRLSYLRSVAVLAAWDGHSEQAIGHLCEAAQIAADLGLPADPGGVGKLV